MRKSDHDRLKAAVWAMPVIDRISLLTLSILDRDKNEPMAAVIGLIETAARMAQYFPEDKRFRLSDRLRNAADLCEKQVLVEDAKE